MKLFIYRKYTADTTVDIMIFADTQETAIDVLARDNLLGATYIYESEVKFPYIFTETRKTPNGTRESN